jgi:hypothetical protein
MEAVRVAKLALLQRTVAQKLAKRGPMWKRDNNNAISKLQK